MDVFTLRIECENAAMRLVMDENTGEDVPNQQAIRNLLHAVADRVGSGMVHGGISDDNGNHVGSFELALAENNRQNEDV